MNYYAVERTGDHLAHYGIKGMRWGVRKAIVMGNQKKLDQHFKKAAKKLSKLQDKALHSGKYAAKAAAYGVAAAGTGSVAIGDTSGALSKYLQKRFSPHSKYMAVYKKYVEPHKGTSQKAYEAAVESLRKSQGISDQVSHDKLASGAKIKSLGDLIEKHNKEIRIGAGIATAGLGALAAKNAYIATHKSKYINKADSFKRNMDEAFSGTKYQGQYVAPPKKKKKRR